MLRLLINYNLNNRSNKIGIQAFSNPKQKQPKKYQIKYLINCKTIGKSQIHSYKIIQIRMNKYIN